MAINDPLAVSVGDLLTQSLRIPHYQRPYSWEPGTALQLVDDVRDALDPRTNPSAAPYVLGAVVLHEHDDGFDVVDGQQRLLTLRMIAAILRSERLFGDVSEKHLPDANHKSPAILAVWTELERHLKKVTEKQDLLQFINDRCQLVRIVTDNIDEAFRVFDSQNYRGKELAPHDLLKAYHLREMQGESAALKVAIVEDWEAVKDDHLNRLFSTFLYRIARWSRGEGAPGFTNHDIQMFKGITAKDINRMPPNRRYYLAAQTMMPLLNTLDTLAGRDERDVRRSRFQLDVPLIAGRPFFEMVSFMLKELNELENEIKDRFGEFGPSRSRYRYVYELFVAALLYYTNKFGNEELDEARDILFIWAYALRLESSRVQFRSVDNRARRSDAAKSPSPFVLLRNALICRDVRRISTKFGDPGDHDKQLYVFIQELKAQ